MNKLEGNIGVVYPTFEEYPNRKFEAEIIPFVPQNADFAYTADDLQRFYEEKEISTLLLINPDNPSGNFIPKEDILRLAAWTAKKDITLIVDESFVDFSSLSYRNTLLVNEILEKYPNLIVVKSISKSYGVPGLRLGLAACSGKELPI